MAPSIGRIGADEEKTFGLANALVARTRWDDNEVPRFQFNLVSRHAAKKCRHFALSYPK